MSLYLQKRNNTFYFRLRVPQDLQQYFSGGEIKRSLKTNNKQLARVAALGHQHEADRLFAYIRSGVLTPTQIAGLIEKSFTVGPKPVATKSPSKTPPRKPKSEKLSELIVKYVEEHMVQGKWKEKTHQEVTSALELAVSILGDVSAKSIDRSVMVDYLGKLKRLPVNMRKSGKPVKKLLGQENKSTLSQRTINKYITRISSLFIWCIRQGYLDRNPAEGLSIASMVKEDEERKAYSVNELRKIRHTLAEHKIEAPERYFVPLVAAYCGARLNEICQLHVEDVKQVDGVWCFDINDEGDRQLKNKSSRRVIPVHPELVRLGLLDHVEAMRSSGKPRLWMNLELKRDGYSHDFGKWYQRFNRKDITQDPKKVFHSFRHTVADTLKQAGVEGAVIAEILGHANQSITTGRYGKRYRPQVLLEALELLEY